MKLEGKVALITGGGTGIGAAVAERFIQEGAKVCISGRRSEMLDKVAQSLHSEALITCQGDTTKDEDVARMVTTTVSFGGKLDILVNNAAINPSGTVTEVDRAMWRQVVDINLTGPFMLMQEAIPHMIKNGGGSIINIASVGGLRCLPAMAAYCSSKAAVIMLTQQAALDYGSKRIRCNAVCPGFTRTAMTDREFGKFGEMLGIELEEFYSRITKATPLERYAVAPEMGGVCTFLASDDSSFMTGAALVVDGGMAIVDVTGASIMGEMRRAGLV